ncbi:MAG: dienelactone hydrolase family protein [Thermoplasmatota archaeon]
MTGAEWPMEIRQGRSNVGVVLIHDITGLDKTNLSFADKLAEEGFWCAAVDLFRGERPADLQSAMAVRQKIQPTDIREGLRAGFDRLRKEMGPQAKIGSMGFCMGGGAALEGACHVPFDFCVDYYGLIANADDVKGLHGPVLLILASEDDRVNSWAFGQFLPKMDEHRKRLHVELYPAVVHPFHRPDWIQSPFSGAKSYDAPTADDAWKRSMAFIRESTAMATPGSRAAYVATG